MICSNCGKNIDKLMYDEIINEKGTYTGGEYRQEIIDVVMATFDCPVCSATLFKDEASARDAILGLVNRCVIRGELVKNGYSVPVGDSYYEPSIDDNAPKPYFWDEDGNLFVKFGGEYHECVGTDWDFITIEESEVT